MAWASMSPGAASVRATMRRRCSAMTRAHPTRRSRASRLTAIEKAGLDTKIWLLDHNFNLWGRVFNTLEDPNVFKYADGVAWHPYVGAPEAMTRIHDAYPTKSAYWTEGGFELAAGKGSIEF